MRAKRMVVSLTLFNLGVVVLATLVIIGMVFQESVAETEAVTGVVTDAATAGRQGWGYIAAALAVGLSSLGAAIAVATVGSAAMGALSENPDLGGRALIFLGLAEGIAIYGLIIAIMILGKF